MSEQGTAGFSILVAAFSDEAAAAEALEAMKQAKKEKQIYFEDVAIIKKDPVGRLQIKETGDVSPGKGAGIGTVMGGVIGLIGGPAGVLLGAGAGATIGGLGSAHDAGFRDENLEEIGNSLEPGTSAIVATTSNAFLEHSEDYISKYDARVMTHELGEEIAEALRFGKDVAFTASATEEGVIAAKVTADDPAAGLLGIDATEKGDEDDREEKS